MTRAPLLLIPVVALGFVVAGCGGGSGSSQGGFATTTTDTSTEAATEAATTEAVTTRATTTASNIGGLGSTKNCRDLANLSQSFSSAFTGAANSKNLDKQAQLLKEFAAKTPADVRDDFNVLADYMRKIADAVGNLKPGSTPDAQTLAKLQKLGTEIDQTKLRQASTHIATWVQKNCHA